MAVLTVGAPHVLFVLLLTWISWYAPSTASNAEEGIFPVSRPSVAIITPVRYPAHVHLLLPSVRRATRFWNVRWYLVYQNYTAIPCWFGPNGFLAQLAFPGTALDRINFVLTLAAFSAFRGYTMILHDTDMLLPTLPLVVLEEDAYLIYKANPITSNQNRTVTFLARGHFLKPIPKIGVDLSPAEIDELFVKTLREKKSHSLVSLKEPHLLTGILNQFCGPHQFPALCYPFRTASEIQRDPGFSKRPNVHIVTATARPLFLLLGLPFVEDAWEWWNVTWWIIYDQRQVAAPMDFSPLKPTVNIVHRFFDTTGEWQGAGQWNLAIELIQDPNAYITILDDDTALHPNLPRTPLITNTIVYGQSHGGPWHAGCSEKTYLAERVPVLQPGKIDVGQWIATRAAIGDIRFRNGPSVYWKSDGFFIVALAARNRRSLTVINHTLGYYNAFHDWCLKRGCERKRAVALKRKSNRCSTYQGRCPREQFLDAIKWCIGECSVGQCCVPMQHKPSPPLLLQTRQRT